MGISFITSELPWAVVFCLFGACSLYLVLFGPGFLFGLPLNSGLGAPIGNEILMAVASCIPFTDQAGLDVQTHHFQEFKDTILEALAHCGISVDEKKVLTGRALHLCRVEAMK